MKGESNEERGGGNEICNEVNLGKIPWISFHWVFIVFPRI